MASINQPFLVAMLLELASIGFLIIGIATLHSDTQSRMRQMYMATCLCLMVWSMGYGYMTIAVHPGMTHLLWAIGFSACCMMFPFWLHFLLYITDVPLPRHPLWIAPFYIVSGFLAAMSVLFDGVTFVSTQWGSQFFYTGGWVKAALVFIMLEIVVFCVLQVYWWRSPRPKRQQRQAFVFMILTFIVAPIGILPEFILPGFFGRNSFPLATLPMFIMALLLYRTVRVNKGLDVTVDNAAALVFHHVRMPTLLLDDKNVVVMDNESAQAFWGRPRGLIGKNAVRLFKVNGEMPSAALLNTDAEAQKVEVVTAQGSRICEMQLIVTFDNFGEVLYKVAVFLDVTDMLHALETAHIASQAKGDFLSHMSHELRTPLNAVTGLLLIAQKAFHSDDMEKAAHAVDGAVKASDHLLGVINDVLDMSKIEAGKYEIVCQPFCLPAALYEVASIISQRCQENHLQFIHNLDTLPEIWVSGDKLRIKQILINILGNSVKFTKDGGTIRLVVDIGDGGSEVLLTFTLSDNGIGMSPEFLARVFEPFEQADGSGRSGGTGLGMPISKTLANLMGGDITAESTLGAGSTFRLVLTLALAEAQAIPTDEAAVNYDFAGKRILVAEDVEINRLILRELLAETGVIIEEAEDGQRTVELFAVSQSQYYDLVLMDVQMPRMDGYEATKRIRVLDHPDAVSVPIIAMTANAYQEDVTKALDAGMNGHLAKPIDLDVALRTLATYLVKEARA